MMDLDGRERVIEATRSGPGKWVPSSPTPAHWYELPHFERLLGAHITHDLAVGREQTVREFVASFMGLTSTVKQRRVLEDTGLSGKSLSVLTDGRDFNHELVAGLLKSMKTHSTAPSPRRLGEIGQAHIAARFQMLDIDPDSFGYNKETFVSDDGVPQVAEFAFASLENDEAWRRLITGVNWSAGFNNVFRDLGALGDFEAVLAEGRFRYADPVVVLAHVAHPRIEYKDRGKTTVVAS